MITRGAGAVLIVVEGIDGSGKSSVVEALGEKLRYAKKLRAPTCEFRGYAQRCGTAAGSMLVHLADFAEMIGSEIVPSMIAGQDVIVDRMWPSTIVYQGGQANCASAMESIVLSAVSLAFREALSGAGESETIIKSNVVVVVLDAPVDTALSRVRARGGELDVHERADRSVWEARRARYLGLDRQDTLGADVVLVSTENRAPADVADEILSRIGIAHERV